MLAGNWEDAWAASDAISQRGPGARGFWDGAPLAGRRVMLRCLHGFGDALQFIRYAPLLGSRSVCVETHPEMVELLQACDGIGEVITWAPPLAEPPAWDAQIEIMELPWIFRSTPATVPARFPYLDVRRLPGDPAFTERVRTRRAQGLVQYGFSWQSSGWNPLRSVPFPELARALGGFADGYSLQQGGGAELAGTRFENIEGEFPALAARMAELDCVVTVDGVLAHLAGALGLPVLLLLPYAADWRWGLGVTTPWYPQMRLFRQQTPGDWGPPLRGAAEALRKLEG